MSTTLLSPEDGASLYLTRFYSHLCGEEERAVCYQITRKQRHTDLDCVQLTRNQMFELCHAFLQDVEATIYQDDKTL